MKFATIFAAIATFVTFSAPALADFVTYDRIYDSSKLSLNNVACSNGANGLVTKGFTTFDSLPRYPYIGGAKAVSGWNSPNCGSCWKLSYNGYEIRLIAIDTAGHGFNIAKQAMDQLTGGRAVELGKIDAVATRVPDSECGLSTTKCPTK